MILQALISPTLHYTLPGLLRPAAGSIPSVSSRPAPGTICLALVWQPAGFPAPEVTMIWLSYAKFCDQKMMVANPLKLSCYIFVQHF